MAVVNKRPSRTGPALQALSAAPACNGGGFCASRVVLVPCRGAPQMLLFVFLARNKSKDLRRVREISRYLVGLGVPTTLLIFPEGTDLSPSNHQKSLEFARKEGLAEYRYVLHPKVGLVHTRGFFSGDGMRRLSGAEGARSGGCWPK